MTLDERLELLAGLSLSLLRAMEGLLAIQAHHDTQILALVQVAERNERRWTESEHNPS